MSYRRRYRRRTPYRRYRPAAPARQGPDSCLVGIVVVLTTWLLCLLAVGIAIALHR